MKRVVILGSTGSIGVQTLEVIAENPGRLQAVGLAARSNEALLREQAARFGVKNLALFAETPGVPSGIEAIADLAALNEADIVVVCVAGVIGLIPTLRAIEAGKAIALASKEVLVAAGELVMPLIQKHRIRLTPIDSEHSAIFQCLQGYPADQVERLILTASGGPFRGKKAKDLTGVTVEQALNHPTWRMGGKITVDSATLMNKGLETIEAKWLFGVDLEKVETVIHPQSVVHSFVKFIDGSALAQMGWPNMKLPILVALMHPERAPNGQKPWNPLDTPSLTFEPVDHATFPSIGLAVRSAKIGGTAPCAMNAANEEAANAFLAGRVGFRQIPEIVEYVLESHRPLAPTLENILAADAEARLLTSRKMDENAVLG